MSKLELDVMLSLRMGAKPITLTNADVEEKWRHPMLDISLPFVDTTLALVRRLSQRVHPSSADASAP
eukprot:6197079-Pleurochrysis_carterae.AAC.1